MMAAHWGSSDLFGLLFTNGADLALADSADDTVLHLASHGGEIGLVEDVLLHNIVNIDARNKDGKTATMVSKDNGQMLMYDLLGTGGCPEN